MTTRSIYCCGCVAHTRARLTDGEEIYPHRPDLWRRPFWVCDHCGNHVGCHHKTDNPTEPLGVIPTPEISAARREIHNALDVLWKCGGYRRRELYRAISRRLGYSYHTAEIRSLDEAARVIDIITELQNGSEQERRSRA